MDFGAIAKQVRSKLSLIQEQLARELNISFSTINSWENGKSQPSQMAKELFFSFCISQNIDSKLYVRGGKYK